MIFITGGLREKYSLIKKKKLIENLDFNLLYDL